MDTTNPNLFSPQPTGSSNNSEEWKPPEPTFQARQDQRRSAWISALSRQVLSSYRRDDFADPDGFLVQLGMVLERYPDAVIRDITSPLTGIQRRTKWPPSIAEVVEACDAEVARLARIAQASSYRTAPRAERAPQHRANVFVPADNPRYAALVEKSRTADPMDWKWDNVRPGIWVALGWVDEEAGPTVRHSLSQFTVDDLRAIYARHDAAGEAA